MSEQAERPSENVAWLTRLFLLQAVLVASLEVCRHYGLAPLDYLAVRMWVVANRNLSLLLVALLQVLLILVGRRFMLFWHNEVKARLTGTYFTPESHAFPLLKFELLPALAATPKGVTFVGQRMKRSPIGWKSTPEYLTDKQRSMHTHVLGKTGSGKTASVLWPLVLQDALAGRGVLVIDAKGSDENVKVMKAIAAAAGRLSSLRVFSLPALNNETIFSHSYNMLHVAPRTSTSRGGDVDATAERVFSVLQLGDNVYYNTQAQQMFRSLCRLLHGMLDATGNGLPFVIGDVAVVCKGINGVGGYKAALDYCLEHSTAKTAAQEIENHIARLGNDANKCFSGLVGALDSFLSPILNAYAPDIVFEDVLQQNLLVYAQLPANLFKLQAPALGRVILQDVQQEGSLRQIHRSARNQTPFSVVVDEFYNFADLSVVDSLNKLRDANLLYTLAHQSIADLELVDENFAVAVWDNTRTKFILAQDNPELCEKVAKSIGTHQVVEKTVRAQQGALFTSLQTGDASTKLVETFRLHPNAIKQLAQHGQGYCYFGQQIVPLSFSMLPKEFSLDAALPRQSQTGVPGLRLAERFLQSDTQSPPHQPTGSSPL